MLAFAPTVISDDTEAAADGFRPYLALYIGGMGAKEMNFHFDVFARMGYEEAATKIQDAYLDGRKDDAAAAVPTAMVEDIALVGPVEKIRDDLEAWRESRATTMLINGDVATLAHHGRARARLTPPGRRPTAPCPAVTSLVGPAAAGPTYGASPKPRIGMKMNGQEDQPDGEARCSWRTTSPGRWQTMMPMTTMIQPRTG